jgi:putative aldouronate transport system permease protein
MRLKKTQANGQAAAVKRQPNIFIRMLQQWDLQILILPGILLMIVFSYFPIYGIIMGFQNYQLGDFPGTSEWVGFKYFVELLTADDFWKVMRNTLIMSFAKMFICFPMPVLFAVMLNELTFEPLKKTVQTVSYLPHFISWVVTATLMMDFLSVNGGAVNEFLMATGIVKQPIGFFIEGKYFYSLVILTDIWKELGWNSIIYISAITSIGQDMYEAADIDGATRIQKMWYITIQSILPTVILMFIFQVGGLLNANFDQIMQFTNMMTNAMLRDYADVLDTYIYRMGISLGRFSFGTAGGLLKSVVNFLLLMLANKIADMVSETSLF